jgi:hypothetical protein
MAEIEELSNSVITQVRMAKLTEYDDYLAAFQTQKANLLNKSKSR